MASEPHRAGSHRIANLIEKFRSKKYRHAYVASHTRRFLARQMRKFRGDMSQSQFGDALGKQQTVVSRLEDPSYGKWTLQTLFEVADKLDVAVFVRFVDFETFLRLSNELDDSASKPSKYDGKRLERMVQEDVSPSLVEKILSEQRSSTAQSSILSSAGRLISKVKSDQPGLPHRGSVSQ